MKFELKVNTKGESLGCLICGEEVSSLAAKEDMTCVFCEQVLPADSCCTQMHFVCDDCYKLSPFDVVKSYCNKYKGTDPIALAVQIMNTSAIKMHGPEHHFIVPAVLLTCLNNLKDIPENIDDKFELANRRAYESIPNCTFNIGTCGAAQGAGIFLSIFNNLEPLSEDEWSLSNSIIADSLKKISETHGQRCCKRDTYLSIEASIDFLAEKYAIELPKSEAKCTFSLRNNTCAREECSFYNLGWSVG